MTLSGVSGEWPGVIDLPLSEAVHKEVPKITSGTHLLGIVVFQPFGLCSI